MPKDASNSPPATAGKPRYAVPALDKGLAILEFLAADGGAHTQTAIARQLGRSQGEIFRMLTCLEQHEYIRRGPGNERYTLTSKLFELAHTHPPTAKLIDLALPTMRHFVEQTEQSCHLAVPQNQQAVVIAQVDSPAFVGVSVRPGRTLGFHEGASGRVLAAFAPADIQAIWLDELKAKLSARRYKELTSVLGRIQTAGHDIFPSVVISGILDLSVPVFGPRGGAHAVLSCPCIPRHPKNTVPRVIKDMTRAAARISRDIGYGSIG